MFNSPEIYCEWVGQLSTMLFHLLNFGLLTGALYGFWLARKTGEILFPILLLSLLILKLLSSQITAINDSFIDGLSFLALSLGFAWVSLQNVISSGKKAIIGVLLILATFVALDSLSNIEYYRLFLWLAIVINLLLLFKAWWRRVAAVLIGSIWLLVPAISPDPYLCLYFNMMWTLFSLVCVASLIELKIND